MHCELYGNSLYCLYSVNKRSFCNIRKGFILVGMEEGVWAEKKPPSIPQALFPSAQASKAFFAGGETCLLSIAEGPRCSLIKTQLTYSRGFHI